MDITPAETSKADTNKKTRLNDAKSNSSLRTASTPLPLYSEVWAEDGGKEVVAIGEGKEVVPSEGLQLETAGDEKHIVVPEHEKEAFLGTPYGEREEHVRKKRLCGMRRKPFFLTLGVLVVCCVITAIALALNLKKNK
jgi:hypothetical protein